ncbi:hypothetical protein [Virgibacillus salidurans]|uniref:hypothetical protein n=1 Tax=Virgibacillus salidurans TaxID=2831673 RepID=UPI001F402769|nr:hypothetical protein [Virgibacillus sp. NKC19-16]
MWNAYKQYDPDKGLMATYFNFMILNRLIDLLRKENPRERTSTNCPDRIKHRSENLTTHCFSFTSLSYRNKNSFP